MRKEEGRVSAREKIWRFIDVTFALHLRFVTEWSRL